MTDSAETRAMAEAHQKAADHMAQGRGQFMPGAHPSQLPGRKASQDPATMGQPKGKGQ